MKIIKNQIIFCFLIIAYFSSCSNSLDKTEEKNSKLKVVTTTGMLEDAVINVAGDAVEVTALMGPGIDPHLYKATQGDLKKLTSAQLIFYNGLHLEGKMGEVFQKLGRVKPVIPAAENIQKSDLRQSLIYQNTYDPHVWFDVKLWKAVVQNVSDHLQEKDPENSVLYQRNTVNYLYRLDSLHKAVEKEILRIPSSQRVLVTAHDAFGYFGDAYQIEVRGLQGISTLSEFGLKDISDLVKFITSRKIKAVFVETSVSEKAVNAVVEGCQKNGFEVTVGGSLYSDAMGEKGSSSGTYIGMVDSNVRTIVNALK